MEVWIRLPRTVLNPLLFPSCCDLDPKFRLKTAMHTLHFVNKQIIDDWVQCYHRGERTFTVLLHLHASHAYPVRLEYFRSFRES